MIFSSRQEYTSEKNGKIVVDQFFGSKSIIVNGCLEAGVYLINMWKGAISLLPKNVKPKNVLILGLGGGNILNILQKKYKDIKITVVEWDEVMIEIAKGLKLFDLNKDVKICNKDAFLLLNTMTEKFDLVIVDLFTGPTPPEFLADDGFLNNLKKVLKQDGYLFLNVYKHVDYIKNFQKHFFTEKVWKYKLNTLAMLRQVNYIETLPKVFKDIRQSELFLKGSFRNGEFLHEGGIWGVRHSIPFLAIEYYTGDEEPKLLPFNGLRFVIWDRPLSDTKIKGYHQMIPGFGLSTVVVSDLVKEKYWEDWSETARRYKKKWETQTDYEINKIDLETFKSYYIDFGLPKETRKASMESLSYRFSVSKENMYLISLKHKESGEIIAGMAFINAKEISHGYYLYAFLNKEKAPAQAGLWLIDNWFAYCKENGIRFANFGPVWTPGQPKSWKGFTEFKSHFRPITLKYKRPLFRFTLK